MAKAQKRGSGYYLGRLQSEHPGIYADYRAGKYRSVRAAAIAARLIRPRTQLQALKTAWNKATPQERRSFLGWLRSTSTATSPVPTSASTTPTPAAVIAATSRDRRLEHWALSRIPYIMSHRGLTNNQVMREMGIDPRNTSLWSAIASKGSKRISKDLVTPLDQWLDDNRHI